MKSAIVVCFLGIVILAACSKSNEVDQSGGSPGNPPAACDTADMKYAANVQPIIQSNCYECHGNGRSDGGISLDTHAKLRTLALNGQLMGVITHASGFFPMPKGRSKLSDCNINKIRSWVQRGALNN